MGMATIKVASGAQAIAELEAATGLKLREEGRRTQTTLVVAGPDRPSTLDAPLVPSVDP